MAAPRLTTLAEFVKRRMAETGLTQVELSRRSGLSKSEVNAIVRGRVGLPGPEKRRRLAEALGVSHQALLVAAGELTEEEAGVAAMTYQPPFREGDVRRKIVDKLPELRDDDAEFVRIVVESAIDRRRTIGVQEVIPEAQQAPEAAALGVGQWQTRFLPVEPDEEEPVAVVV